MGERMTAADVSFFYLEGRTTPQHVGGLAVFECPPAAFSYDRLVQLIEERISLAPRFRQKMRTVPAHLANPVWVDDPTFDITYHVRRSALPRPGSEDQLLEFCARIQSRLLDRDRPLWEMYLVEGLADGRVAVVTKTHHSMVDGRDAIDIAQVMLDASAEPRRTVEPLWMPEPEPSSLRLARDALVGVARRPAAVVEAVRLSAGDARQVAGRAWSVLDHVVSAGTSLVTRGRPSPLSVTLSEQRRMAVARTRLEDYRTVRSRSHVTVNDAVLATVTGALRGWLLARGEALHPSTTVRALVPVSVRADDGDGWGVAEKVTGLVIDLPVGEPDARLRLARVGFAMATHRRSGRSVGADALVALSGFAPPTLHSLGARAASGLTSRMVDVVVTNVPGPQLPLYLAGARLREMFPILPLSQRQALSIGLTSYDGGVYFGINADRDAVPDVALLASLIDESLGELLTATAGAATGELAGGSRGER